MKKSGVFLFAITLTATISAQDKNILNHLDVGVNVGTVGVGIDVAVPLGNYVRLRAGYNYIPRINFHSNFPIETNNGSISSAMQNLKGVDLKKMASGMGLDLDNPAFKEVKDDFDKFSGITPKDYVTMNLQPSLHQFKFLVDVMPFKNKHWSFTAGFFAGPSNVGSAINASEETQLLEAVTTYNKYYVRICKDEGIVNGNHVESIEKAFKDRGVAGFPLGYLENGNKAMMIPNEDGTARAELEISKIRPYVGCGYNTHLSRNKKWNLNVDAGVLILCRKPSIYVDNIYSIDRNAPKTYEDSYGIPWNNYDIVHPNMDYINYLNDGGEPDPNQSEWICDRDDPSKFLQHVDLMRDLHDMPNGKVRDMVNTISKFKVYPNLSVTVSYRLY